MRQGSSVPNRRLATLLAGLILAAEAVCGQGQDVRLVGQSAPVTEPLVGVFAEEGLAYAAASGNGLVIYDVADPTSPTAISPYVISGADCVFVSGGLAYVGGTNGFSILDVTAPRDPAFVTFYTIPFRVSDIFVQKNTVYAAAELLGLWIVDVSDPTSPMLVSTLATPDRAYGVHVAGNYAYVADWNSGLQIVDVSRPASPQIRGNYNTVPTFFDVYVSGNVAYIADGNLDIVDVSDPEAPKRLGAIGTSGQSRAVQVAGRYAYVGDGQNGLQVADVGNPAAASIRGSYAVAGFGIDVFVDDGLVYLAGEQNGFAIMQFFGEAPRIEAATTADLDRDGVIGPDDQLILSLSRSVVLQPGVLQAGHFFLPVAGDSLGFDTFQVDVNPYNSRQIVMTLGLGAQLTPVGEFDLATSTVGSPSGIDFDAGLPFGAITSLDGISAIDGGAPGENDAGVDARFALVGDEAGIGPAGGTVTLIDSPDADYTQHAFGIPQGGLVTTATIRLQSPGATLGVAGAVQVASDDPVSTFPAARRATIRVEFFDRDVDREQGLIEAEMRVHQLVENPLGTFQYIEVPGTHRVRPTRSGPAGQGVQRQANGSGEVSVPLDSLNPGGSLGETGVFAGIPVETVDERTISIKPRRGAPVRKAQNGVTLTPGPRGAYTKHGIEFPGYEQAIASDPDRFDVTIRTALLAERESQTGGQSFPANSGAVFVVEVNDALGQAVEFTTPVVVTVQYKERSDPSLSDLVKFSGSPALETGMRVAYDQFAGEAVSFTFVGAPPHTVDTTAGTVTVENVVGLTGVDGEGTFGAVASGVFTPTRRWERYR